MKIEIDEELINDLIEDIDEHQYLLWWNADTCMSKAEWSAGRFDVINEKIALIKTMIDDAQKEAP